MIEAVVRALRGKKLSLEDEKALQSQINEALVAALPGEDVIREVILDSKNTIDFMVGNLGIEVKINGQKMSIYRQCERYCGFDQIKSLLLITNRSMGFPEQINGKDCYVLNLGKAWL